MREVQVGIHGHVALVDDADYAQVAQYRWSLFRDRDKRTREVRRLYAYRKWWETDPDGVRLCRGQLMHVLLMGQTGVDHQDGDGLNNQRTNLRIATRSQNGGNSRQHASQTSRFKGVTRDRYGWRAQLTDNRRRVLARVFRVEEEAARAYDAAAREHFGEFAHVNFPEELGVLPVGLEVALHG